MASDSFKQRRRDATAEILLTAAVSVIARKGYQNVTMRDIAAQAGCTPGTLYLYFKDKRGLVIAIMERHSSVALQSLTSAMAAASDPLEKLRLLTEAAVEYFAQNQSLFKVLYSWKPVPPPHLMPDLPGTIRDEWEKLWRAELEVIRQAQAAGEIRQDFPAESIHRFMHGLIIGFFEGLSAQETLPPKEEAMRTLWGFLTGGIGARRDHETTP